MSVSLDSIINIAGSGLNAAQAGIGVLSDNVANAGIAGYTAKSLDLSAFQAGTRTIGVRIGPISRSVDAAVQNSLLSTNGTVAGLTIRSQAMQAINAVQGTPGDGTSLSDAVTALQNGFTALAAQPSSATQQSAVVSAATTLASTINAAAGAVTTQRNAAQAQIVTTVDGLNTALTTVQQTTHQIQQAISDGTSTASLEDQRDAALSTLSSDLDLHYDKQADGGITLLGQNGFSIPLDSRFSTSGANLAPQAAYSGSGGSVPPILLQSSNPAAAPIDVTKQLSGGALGALIDLRDNTLPAYTAQLDEFSQSLATRFSAQGLTLFTTAAGTVPAGGGNPVQSSYIGLSSEIQVNAAVAAKPSLVRDGTQTVAGSATGASSFTPNPAGGPAGFSTLINRVLNFTFGTNAATGVGNAAAASTGLGPLGTLSSTISSTADLAGTAQAIVAGQSAATANAASDLTAAQSYQTTIQARFSDGAGVNVDHEMGLMIQLQNSYQANARVLQTAQQLFTALLTAVSA